VTGVAIDVSVPTLIKIALAGENKKNVDNNYTEFHENLADILVLHTRS
jgi:hypothetical protein